MSHEKYLSVFLCWPFFHSLVFPLVVKLYVCFTPISVFINNDRPLGTCCWDLLLWLIGRILILMSSFCPAPSVISIMVWISKGKWRMNSDQISPERALRSVCSLRHYFFVLHSGKKDRWKTWCCFGEEISTKPSFCTS
jgi:hypothetical protein